MFTKSVAERWSTFLKINSLRVLVKPITPLASILDQKIPMPAWMTMDGIHCTVKSHSQRAALATCLHRELVAGGIALVEKCEPWWEARRVWPVCPPCFAAQLRNQGRAWARVTGVPVSDQGAVWGDLDLFLRFGCWPMHYRFLWGHRK